MTMENRFPGYPPRELQPSMDQDEGEGWSRRYPASFWVPVLKLPHAVSEVLLSAVLVRSEDDLARLYALEHRRQEAILRNEEMVVKTDKKVNEERQKARSQTADTLKDTFNSFYEGLDERVGLNEPFAQRAEIALELTRLWFDHYYGR